MCLNVYVIAWLEFELTFYDVTIERVSQNLLWFLTFLHYKIDCI